MKGQDVVYANLAGIMEPQAEAIVEAMHEWGLNRLIFISSMGIYSEVRGEQYRSVLDPYRDSATVIESSDLDYTVLRPGWFMHDERIDYQLTQKGEPFRGQWGFLEQSGRPAREVGHDARPAPLWQPRRWRDLNHSRRTRYTMELKRNGTQPSVKGPVQCFTGTVRIDPLFSPTAPARTSAASVTFEPGARSNWHTHPLGQKLIVICGCGYVQSWGQPLRVIRPGDVVECPPGEKHWHGAAPGTAMTHIAIQEELNGKVVDWLEPVTDEQYGSAPADP